MNKDVKVKVLFCESDLCLNNIGHAGEVIRNPATDQRKFICGDCREKFGYKKWVTELKWK